MSYLIYKNEMSGEVLREKINLINENEVLLIMDKVIDNYNEKEVIIDFEDGTELTIEILTYYKTSNNKYTIYKLKEIVYEE